MLQECDSEVDAQVAWKPCGYFYSDGDYWLKVWIPWNQTIQQTLNQRWFNVSCFIYLLGW